MAELLMLLCLRQASSPEPAEPVYPEPGRVGGADHHPLPPPTLLTCLHTGQWGLGVAACKIVPALQGQGSHTTIICINIAYIAYEC